MKKIFLLLIIIFGLSGCSLLKVVSAPFQAVKNTVPQSINQSKGKEVCKGKAIFNEDGSIRECSKGYYNYEENKAQQDRKLTLGEKIGQFFARLTGYGILLLFVGGVLSFMGLGGLVTAFITGAANVGKTGLKGVRQIMEAIQKTKDNNAELIQALDSSTDEDVKRWITEFKQKNKIK